MRGAFSGGAMVGLQKQKLTDCFDYIYSSSSGSCAGAYFLSGQAEKDLQFTIKNLMVINLLNPGNKSGC